MIDEADISEIKRYSLEKMRDTTFARVIALEPDRIPIAQFLSKVSVWFAILKLEENDEG